MRSKTTSTATIPNGAPVSNAVNLGDKILCGVIVSAAWTAAALSFQVSHDGGTTWFDLYALGGATEVSIASGNVVAGRFVPLDPAGFVSIDMIRVRSGVTGTPVNQSGDRVLTLIARKIYALD